MIKQDWGVISQVTFESVERTESEKAVGRRLDESDESQTQMLSGRLRDNRHMRDSYRNKPC